MFLGETLMKQFEVLKERNEEISERLELVMERVAEIAASPEVKEPFADYFKIAAERILLLYELSNKALAGEILTMSLEEGKAYNEKLYAEIRDNYETSYANPAYAVSKLGTEYGRLFSAIYSEIVNGAPYIYQGKSEYACIYAELFVEIYAYLLDEDAKYEGVLDIYYWFRFDYSEIFTAEIVNRMVNHELDYCEHIVMESDLTDPAYMYRYGRYVSDNELGIAAFLNTLSEEEIEKMASTYTEGYRIGFEVSNKSLAGKTTVDIRCFIGFERMIRAAVKNFDKLGLKPFFGLMTSKVNPQFVYDHKDDQGLILDKKLSERNIEVFRDTFEAHKDSAWGYAGPAVIEVFGEKPFAPIAKKENVSLNEKQQQIDVAFRGDMMRLMYTYIDGKNRSFTIISYPIPEIGPQFNEIFAETVKLNTLDYILYRDMQQKIIDALDTGVKAHILGANGNKTDLYVSLFPLTDPSKQTIFENCVADVNIPVGEVFTSPVLKGTTGKLHVSQVYLNGLNYKNLEIDFVDGMITGYCCTNYEDAEEGRAYIKKNVLFNHDTLALGEFAIGTNTTAYKMGRDFDIAAKLPILIAEKTGPHFAVGDTCYTHSEDNVVFNPDGKEIVAKDNDVSILRKTDPSKAYFNCHTDITIPYDELASITAIAADGTETFIIKDGRFVVPGTEELNVPLDAMK